MQSDSIVVNSEDAREFYLAHFLSLQDRFPSILIPIFKKINDNHVYVQNLNESYHVSFFAIYSLDGPIEHRFDYPRTTPLYLKPGDTGIISLRTTQDKILVGNINYIRTFIPDILKNTSLGPFMRLELSYLLHNESEINISIKMASRLIEGNKNRLNWMKAEIDSFRNLLSEKNQAAFEQLEADDQYADGLHFSAQEKAIGFTPEVLAAAWLRVRGRLQQEVGDVEYRTWLRQMTLVGLDGDEITVQLPTRFLRDWVRAQFRDQLTTLWQEVIPSVRRVEVEVGQGAGIGQSEVAIPSSAPRTSPLGLEAILASPATSGNFEAVANTVLDQRFTFDRFVVGKPNEFAHACARRVAEKPASQGFNPLFLYGGVGLGKTHLMHAIAWELTAQDRPGGPVTVAYMSAEKFMYRFISAIRSQATIQFKEQLRSVDVLMIDDLQFLINKDATQEEFFSTIENLIDNGKQVIIASDRAPAYLSEFGERIRTRLSSGMVADVFTTTFELRVSIIEAKAVEAGVNVPGKVVELLARKVTSSIRDLQGALNRLIAHANLFGRAITLDTTQEVLHDTLKAYDKRVTIEEIQKRVAEHWNIRLTDMTSARRARAVARPRQVAMYLAHQLTSRSLPEIGRRFGNRSHSTVTHAVSRVADLVDRDAAFAEDVELLRQRLQS